jgi:succinate-semialdehyde dehydrogenase/glutarate-semialdehyde dehydrogenase
MLKLKDPDLLRQTCLIGGEWLTADDNSTLDVNNPATGETLGTVPRMGAGETRRAIDAAAAAWPAWRARTAGERGCCGPGSICCTKTLTIWRRS